MSSEELILLANASLPVECSLAPLAGLTNGTGESQMEGRWGQQQGQQQGLTL